LKATKKFPQQFYEWFESIFQIYQIRDESGEKVVPFEHLLRLYLFAGKDRSEALKAFNILTSVRFRLFIQFQKVVKSSLILISQITRIKSIN
jgi:hypothetical protein